MARILIAENELALREFIARGLERRGHSVVAADDGAGAFDILKTERFDLLLTDIDMPILDGIALVQAVAGEHPAMKIVVMSGHEHQLERARSMTGLVHRIAPKPFTIAAICAIVDDAIAAAPANRRNAASKGSGKSKGKP